MTIDRNTFVFFDASCLIAAAGSPQGGSGFLLSLCARGFLKGAVSQAVLLEAQRNIQAKLGEKAFNRFSNFLALAPLTLSPLPEKREFIKLEKAVNKKDVHVVAAALAINASFLLALDKELVLEVNKLSFGIQAFTPGEFIKIILPTHMDFPPSGD